MMTPNQRGYHRYTHAAAMEEETPSGLDRSTWRRLAGLKTAICMSFRDTLYVFFCWIFVVVWGAMAVLLFDWGHC